MNWRNRTYVFLNVVQATIVWHKGSNLLPVLHQLDTSTLTDSRVRLLSLNATANEVIHVRYWLICLFFRRNGIYCFVNSHLFKDDSLCVR